MLTARLLSPCALVGLLFLPACGPAEVDFDGDGVLDERDCAPADAAVYPFAPDGVGDDIDQNCDGVDGVDGDRDGWASVASGGEDCDDTDGAVNPSATEHADNLVDEDCNDLVLECDVDGDGEPGAQCAGSDCDDGKVNCALDCTDDDGDGLAACQGDCDDSRGTVLPAVSELCDGLDTDCDQTILADESDLDGDGSRPCDGDCDDGDPDRFPGQVWYPDADGDGHGDPAAGAQSCSPPDEDAVLSSAADDCDDADPANRPGGEELCDGQDNDCGGDIDEGFDEDGDGASSCGGDCDDGNAHRTPSAVEVCDGLDNDCDPAERDLAAPTERRRPASKPACRTYQPSSSPPETAS